MAKDLPGRRVGRRVALSSAFTLLVTLASSPGVSSSQMHVPTFQCADSGALRITCVGHFVDGASAAGITARVFDKHDRLVHVGTVDSQGRISFRKPDAEFHIVFDAGQGNVLTILGSEMT
jgi:hypothetical protein